MGTTKCASASINQLAEAQMGHEVLLRDNDGAALERQAKWLMHMHAKTQR